MVMPLSYYKNLAGGDFNIAQSVRLKFYDDLGGGHKSL